MAGGPTVTLTFDGDEKGAVRAADNVGESFEDLSDNVGKASRDMGEQSGGAFDSMSEGADTAETRFTGFYDTLGGASDVLTTLSDDSLSTQEKLVALGQAGADLAGGLVGFVIPAIKGMAGFMAGPLRTAMTFISSHPLLITLGILIGLIILLWTQSETFRNVVMAAFGAVGNFIKNIFGGSIQWIVDRWNGLMNFFKTVGGAIGRALGGIGGIIGDAFKGALNVAIGVINWFIDRANDIIYGINVISPFDDIPNIPHIAKLATGGKAQRDGLAFLHEGETVRSAGETARGSGGGPIEITGDTNTWLYKMIKQGIRDGKIKLVVP